jgi:DNA-binding IclR family transcriptional regulator
MSDIQSVRRAFEILKSVSARAEGVSLTEIAMQVELPKSTVSRMLSTLVGLGVVERVSAREGFRIGTEFHSIASNYNSPKSLISIARPFMQQLAQITGETLTFCIPDGNFAHYIDQINSLRALQIQNWVGQRIPLHATSDGKLYLAHRSKPEIDNYLHRPLQRYTRATLTSQTTLRKELRAILKKGYAWTNGEYDNDIVGLAAPIFATDGSIAGSICLFGPAFRWPQEVRATQLIRLTKETADKISARLKFAGKAATRTSSKG